MSLPNSYDFTGNDLDPIDSSKFTQFFVAQPMKIFSNHGFSSGIAGAYDKVETYQNDHKSKIRVITTVSNFGPAVRCSGQDATLNFYVGRIFAGGNFLQMFIYLGGVESRQVGATQAVTVVASDVLELIVTGSNPVVLEITQNGVPMTGSPFSDSASDRIQSGGAAGFYDAGSAEIDDWVGNNVSAGGIALPFVTRLDAQRMRQQFTRKLQQHGHDIRNYRRAA